MNIATGFGRGDALRLSDNTGNDEATMLVTLNPLNASADANGLGKTMRFGLLPSLDSLAEAEQSALEQPELEQPLAPTLAIGDEATSTPLHDAIGDKKQALLTHLLNAEETVPAVAAIARPIADAGSAAGAALALNQPIDALAGAVRNQQSATLTPALVNRRDNSMPIKPQFFAQVLLNAAADDNNSTELANNALTPAIKSLSETGESVKTALTQHSVQASGQPSISGESQLNWSPVKLRGSQEQMSEQLHSVLRDRLQIQADSKVQHATIRLDPPNLGKIDISLHIEAGKLNVQINAPQADVYRALQQVSSELRQQLTEQNFVQVNVQVSSDSSQQGHRDGKRETFEEDPILMAREIASSSSVEDKDGSILTTV